MRKSGVLVTNSVYLMPHEQATVDFLLRQGFKVELIPRRQSRNIVLDLRRVKRNENLCIREIQNYLNNSHIIEKILIITKERSLIDMRKKGVVY